MLKAILFDMDGVIVDSEPLHKKAYYKMFKEVNIEVPETLFESFTGQSTLKICQTLCKHFRLTQPPKELVYLKRKHFKYIFENDINFHLKIIIFRISICKKFAGGKMYDYHSFFCC